MTWDSSKSISEERSAIKPFWIISFPHPKVSHRQTLLLYDLCLKSQGLKEQTQRCGVLIPHLCDASHWRQKSQRLAGPPAKSQATGLLPPLNSTHCVYTQLAIYHVQDSSHLSDIVNIVTELEKVRNCGLQFFATPRVTYTELCT